MELNRGAAPSACSLWLSFQTVCLCTHDGTILGVDSLLVSAAWSAPCTSGLTGGKPLDRYCRLNRTCALSSVFGVSATVESAGAG